MVVSDGLQARIGSLTASQEWFKVWRTIDGEGDAPKTALELEVLIRGVFERQRFLDLLVHFIVFEEDPDTVTLHKIIAGYHQGVGWAKRSVPNPRRHHRQPLGMLRFAQPTCTY